MNWDKIDGFLDLNWQRVRWVIGGLGIAFLVLVAGGLVARAEGIGSKSAVASPTPFGTIADGLSWTGFHASASFGGAWTKTEFETQFGDGKHDNAENALATVGVGWDLQMSNIVMGIMADVTASNFDNVEWQWFVGGRVGFLATPKTLVYGLIGYTEALDGQLAFKSIQATRFDNIAGLTYGAGVEHAFASGWALRAEYRFVSYGDEHAPEGKIDGLKDGSDVDTGSHQARLGIVKRF